MELPDLATGRLRPRGEDDLGAAVVLQVDDDGLAGEAEVIARSPAGWDGVRPAPVLGLIEPVGVDLAVVGGIENLHEAVAVEVGDHGAGFSFPDDVVVHGARGAAGAGGWDCGPVEAAAAPARAVELEDKRHVIKVGVGRGAAVVDAADHDQLGDTVAVDVGDDGGTLGEVGAVLDAAVGVSAHVHGVVDVDAHLAPDLRPRRAVADVVEDGVRRKLVSVPVEGGDIVRAGGAEDLLEAVAVHVGHGHVLVEQSVAVARFAAASRRPAGTHGAIGLEDVELGRLPDAVANDDLEKAVLLQVRHRQGVNLAAAEGVSRPDHAAEAVVDGELVGAAADDHLRRTVSRQVGDGDAGPDAVAARCAPLEASVGAVQSHDVVRAPDDVLLAVAVEVGDGRGGVPAILAPGRAAAVLPHQDGRAAACQRLLGPSRKRCNPDPAKDCR